MVKKGGKVLLGLAGASAAGLGLYYLTRKKPEEPVCQDGQTQTRICPDNSVITTATCVNGKWQSTGATCPTQPPEEINAGIISHEWLIVGGQSIARIKVKNTGNAAFTGYIGFSIRPSNYTRFIDADYRNVGTINSGEEKTFTSNPISIPGDAAPGNVEAWVTIRYHNGEDYITLDERRESDAYVIQQQPSAAISNVVVNGGGLVNKSRGERVDVHFNLKNTGNSSIAFDLALEFGTMTNGEYVKFFNGVDSVVIAPGQTIPYNLWFSIPNAAPLNHYFSIGVYVYALDKFDSNNPKANYLDKKSVFDVIYVS